MLSTAFSHPNWLEVVKPHQGENPFKWSRCDRRAEALSFPSSVAALASLVTQLITLVLRRFIALHSNCTNAPDSQTAFMAALLRQQGGCPVIRDGIPARTKGCARQGQAMAKRSNHKLQPLSLRLWPFWLSYMNANALWLAPIKTVITTANMASQAKRGCWKDRGQSQSARWHRLQTDITAQSWKVVCARWNVSLLAAIIVWDKHGVVFFWSRKTWQLQEQAAVLLDDVQ